MKKSRFGGLDLALSSIITAIYGRGHAVAMTLFRRDNALGKIGRQSQTWVRFPDGWKVVAAHGSVIEEV